MRLHLFPQTSISDILVLKTRICSIRLPSYVIENRYGIYRYINELCWSGLSSTLLLVLLYTNKIPTTIPTFSCCQSKADVDRRRSAYVYTAFDRATSKIRVLPLESRRYLISVQSYNHFRFANRHLCFYDVIKGADSLPVAVPNMPHQKNWEFQRKHFVIATRTHSYLYFRNIVRHIEISAPNDVIHGCR
jgi:hypothetical protein